MFRVGRIFLLRGIQVISLHNNFKNKHSCIMIYVHTKYLNLIELPNHEVEESQTLFVSYERLDISTMYFGKIECVIYFPPQQLAVAAPPQQLQVAAPRIPRFLPGSSETHVNIGDNLYSCLVPRDQYWNILNRRELTGTKFVLKMLHVVYTDHEVAQFNFRGGATVIGGGLNIQKRSLDDEVKYKAIVAQAEKEFSRSTTGGNRESLRTAVRNKCNKVRKKLENARI